MILPSAMIAAPTVSLVVLSCGLQVAVGTLNTSASAITYNRMYQDEPLNHFAG